MAQQPNFLGITASVGHTPSVNKPEDVLRVQQLLNSKPDGRVDPGGSNLDPFGGEEAQI